MRTRCGIWLWVVVFGAVCAAVQTGDKPSSGEGFLGTWTGTWDGAGTGGFELTLEKIKDGALGGRVSVLGEPADKATLKSVAFDGKKMNATYDFTPDERAEVVLNLAFDEKSARGTWLLREQREHQRGPERDAGAEQEVGCSRLDAIGGANLIRAYRSTFSSSQMLPRALDIGAAPRLEMPIWVSSRPVNVLRERIEV